MLRRVSACALALLAVACDADPAMDVRGGAVSRRRGPFGSLRDFVLVDQAAGLFVDRFEATQRDWADFSDTAEGRAVGAESVKIVGRMSLPAGGMDLLQARAFARWRCGRLPSAREWQRVTEGGDRSPFPWGSKEDATRANTGDLALGERMPVGTFESGRKSGGDWPYDLIGNVREWTESVPLEWCQDRSADTSSFARSVRRARQQPCIAVWTDRFGLVPAGVLVFAGGLGVPRRCVGADYETQMRFVRERRYDTQGPSERRMRTGLRVYATSADLLRHLMSLDLDVSEDQRQQLVAFVQRDGHRQALRRAYDSSPDLARALAPKSAARVLLNEVLELQ